MKRTKLSPDKQELFCSYTAHVTAKGAGSPDHHLGYVYDFLTEVDKVIAWLVANICDFEYYVKLFKQDFGL